MLTKRYCTKLCTMYGRYCLCAHYVYAESVLLYTYSKLQDMLGKV